MRRKLYTCCVCQFASKAGMLVNGQFTCSACEMEEVEEQEMKYLEEEEYEMSRVGYQHYTVEV